ncbi:hypothetical protein GYMLUDRAFT_167306 [Collybiopsis luxurians FD-317 M1]|uniref:KOW domain-containing protein n=1 Tax=Collybiopsis luxurians FD-317 M1 TaxID=944289 RepID=A0A0D0CEH7_9AGAR|nr:hypothetical protein GYMLUDRAFT_167306 [Collybiopsis luxurians FD-317 M1]
MVIPRLGLTDEDSPSQSSLKRKLTTRPPPQLFDPSKCTRQILVRHGEKHVYTFKSWKFRHGLQVKFYNPHSLTVAHEIHSSFFHLFMKAKELAGEGVEVFETSSMPWPSFWQFVPGDCVIIHSEDGQKLGTVLTSPQRINQYLGCEVSIDNEGDHCILVQHLEKNIILGEFIEVLAGVHAGKKGFVAAKAEVLLGICIGQRTNGVDFQVHVNSPLERHQQHFNVEVPWKEVEVLVQSGHFVGRRGIVKNVRVNFRGSLCLSLWVPDYNCSVDIDHSAVVERQWV